MGIIAWYKRDPSAALRGMRSLTPEERGIYNTVLDLIYDSANELVDDDRFVSGNCNCDIRVYRRVKKRLIGLEKLYIKDGYLRNCTADEAVANLLARHRSNRNAALIKHGKLSRLPKKNNELADADADADADAKVVPYKNQSQNKKDSESDINSELPEQPKESGISDSAPNGANGKDYVFEGKLFRLNSNDFAQWKKAYSHIDLMAELFDLDQYFDRELKGKERKNIYHRMSGAIRKRNQRAMDESKANPCTPRKYKRMEFPF